MDLFVAIREGREDDIVAFIASGADVSAVRSPKYGWTPLHYACVTSGSNAGIVRILIEAGADINERTRPKSSERTPLALAVENEKFDIVKVLLAAGAGPNCEHSYRFAVRDGRRHMLPLLLQHRVPVCVPENWPSRHRWKANEAAWAYHDNLIAAGGYEALVKKHREILASVVDKVVEAKFRRRAPQEVCAHVALFIAPPGGS